MNVGQALQLAQTSMEDFKQKLHDIKIKELYELADNLRFVDRDNIAVFQIGYDTLKKRLVWLCEYMKTWEKKKQDTDPLFYSERLTAFDQTGFGFFHYKSPNFDSRPPSQIFEDLIEQISEWEK